MLGHLDQPGGWLPRTLDDLTTRYATLSAGEKVMLEAAHSFWNDMPGAHLGQILSMLDSAGMQRFVDAVAIRTGKRAQV